MEGAWPSLSIPEEWGGKGLPYSLSLFSMDMAATANFTWTMYPGLSKGAVNTLLAHASQELKEKYFVHQRKIIRESCARFCAQIPRTQLSAFLDKFKRQKVPAFLDL